MFAFTILPCRLLLNKISTNSNYFSYFIFQLTIYSFVILPHTPMSVATKPSAAVDCLPYSADNSKEVLICHEKGWWFGVHSNQ